MPRSRGFFFRLFSILALMLVSAVVAISLTGYGYIYKTLIFTYPGIDDLDIFYTRIVDDPNPKPLPAASNYNKGVVPAAVMEEHAKMESVAFLVLQQDSVLYEQYWDHYDSISPVNSFSMAKSIVGLLVGIAEGEGKLSLDDRAGKYIPQFDNPQSEKLTLRNLLSMSSGLNYDESYSSLFSYTTEAYYGRNLQKLVKKFKVVNEPGAKFEYMSGNTLLLGMILEKATGKKLSDYASEKLWGPVGASRAAFWSLDQADGTEKSYCCFYSNARDFALIGKLILDSGMAGGRQVVPPGFLSRALQPNGLADSEGRTVDYYGWHWWLMDYRGEKVAYARGILGQYIVVVPSKNLVMVRLGKLRGEKSDGKHYDDMKAYLDGALSLADQNRPQ